MKHLPTRIEEIMSKPSVNESTRLFLSSLLEQVDRNGALSEKQLEALRRIEQRNSEEFLIKKEKWRAQYDDEKREAAQICALYYTRGVTGYYSDLAHRVLDEPDFIPTEAQWRAMCLNKFATRVIEETRSEPKYAAGTMVEFRKGLTPLLYKENNVVAMVVESDCGPVLKAAKGSKRYRILPVGESIVIEVEERRIKKYRKKGVKDG